MAMRLRKEGVMGWTKALFFVGGVATAVLAKLASGSKTVRSVAVSAAAKVMDAHDAIQATTQNIMDDADDMRAEAERMRKIDAAVSDRIAKLEEDIRKEVTAEIDGRPVKKVSSRGKK